MRPATSPPSAPQAERAVLGALLLRNERLPELRAIVQPEDFYEPRHRRLWEAALALADAGRPIDVVTLDGHRELALDVLSATPTAEGAADHAHLVADKAALRRLARMLDEIRRDTWQGEENIDTLLERAQAAILAAARQRPQGYEPLGLVLIRTMEGLAQLRTGKIAGISTGLVALDRLLGGLRPDEVVILAGRPGTGKSSLGLQLLVAAARQGVPGLLFTLEMGATQIAERLLSMEARVDLMKLRDGCANRPNDWIEVSRAAPRVAQALKFWIDESSCPTVQQIQASASRWAVAETKGGRGIIVVDYAQLVKGGRDRDSRQQQLGEVSRGFKALSKQLHMPVVVLAQLNRDCEKREDKRPQLVDLREAGDFEQDADAILMLYVEELHDPDTDQQGICEILVRKHRNGPTGMARVRFRREHTAFSDLHEGPHE